MLPKFCNPSFGGKFLKIYHKTVIEDFGVKNILPHNRHRFFSVKYIYHKNFETKILVKYFLKFVKEHTLKIWVWKLFCHRLNTKIVINFEIKKKIYWGALNIAAGRSLSPFAATPGPSHHPGRPSPLFGASGPSPPPCPVTAYVSFMVCFDGFGVFFLKWAFVF